ncbi:zinc metallopeptidase [Metabacillus sediminilitoris]|uniref:Zinc metallopeptidase n=1 Tax=Metabacillus sediminilitoris TaxID=2567941 RepID=A0A4S4C0C1_9BACI|nr:zinc metallopeptidase [Metabacillus sediminilitoris]QGQ47849.1 Zn-dependent protease [Metabacillus sediminilitoris]THF81038.1 zinc metallopeptidase [Metabacillus sediminilitoris]
MGFLIYFIIIMAVPLLIQLYLKNTYKKYSNVGTSSGITGAEAARRVLDENGLYNVKVEPVRGRLTDHYDPRSKVVRLSQDNYYGNSIAAISVATHEVGHAVQDKMDYTPLRIRHALVPVANWGSNLSFFFILAGMLMQASGMFLLGIIFFAVSVLFQVVTLPVEYNASARAHDFMVSSGMIRNNEESGARKVLNAAALTYVAATIIAIMELLRFILMFVGMNNNEE